MSTIYMQASVTHRDPNIGLNESILQRPREQVVRTVLDTAGGLVTATTGAAQDIPMGTVTVPGLAIFENLSTTNYVDIGYTVSAVFRPFAHIPPGRYSEVWLDPAHTWQMQAVGADVKMNYKIFQAET